jgi:hypothetical protein
LAARRPRARDGIISFNHAARKKIPQFLIRNFWKIPYRICSYSDAKEAVIPQESFFISSAALGEFRRAVLVRKRILPENDVREEGCEFEQQNPSFTNRASFPNG